MGTACGLETAGMKVAKTGTFSMTEAGRKNVFCVRVVLLLLWQIKFHGQIIFIGAISVLIFFR